MFDYHPFACRGFFKVLSIDFPWELKLLESFVSSALASKVFVFGYQVDASERLFSRFVEFSYSLWS